MGQRASLVAQLVKNPPAVQPGFSPWVGGFPGGGRAARYSVLAWSLPWTEEPGGLQSLGPHRVGHTHTYTMDQRGPVSPDRMHRGAGHDSTSAAFLTKVHNPSLIKETQQTQIKTHAVKQPPYIFHVKVIKDKG